MCCPPHNLYTNMQMCTSLRVCFVLRLDNVSRSERSRGRGLPCVFELCYRCARGWVVVDEQQSLFIQATNNNKQAEMNPAEVKMTVERLARTPPSPPFHTFLPLLMRTFYSFIHINLNEADGSDPSWTPRAGMCTLAGRQHRWSQQEVDVSSPSTPARDKGFCCHFLSLAERLPAAGPPETTGSVNKIKACLFYGKPQ